MYSRCLPIHLLARRSHGAHVLARLHTSSAFRKGISSTSMVAAAAPAPAPGKQHEYTTSPPSSLALAPCSHVKSLFDGSRNVRAVPPTLDRSVPSLPPSLPSPPPPPPFPWQRAKPGFCLQYGRASGTADGRAGPLSVGFVCVGSGQPRPCTFLHARLHVDYSIPLPLPSPASILLLWAGKSEMGRYPSSVATSTTY